GLTIVTVAGIANRPLAARRFRTIPTSTCSVEGQVDGTPALSAFPEAGSGRQEEHPRNDGGRHQGEARPRREVPPGGRARGERVRQGPPARGGPPGQGRAGARRR